VPQPRAAHAIDAAPCANIPGPARVVTSGGAGSDDAPIPSPNKGLGSAGASDVPK